MRAFEQFGLVGRREMTEALRSRSFRLTTGALMLFGLIGDLVLGHHVTVTHTYRLAVVGAMPAGLPEAAAQMASEAERTRIQLTTVPDVTNGRAELSAGRLSALAVDPTHVLVLKGRQTHDAALRFGALHRAALARRLSEAGVGPTKSTGSSPSLRRSASILPAFPRRRPSGPRRWLPDSSGSPFCVR